MAFVYLMEIIINRLFEKLETENESKIMGTKVPEFDRVIRNDMDFPYRCQGFAW